jgi:7-cyano-7-deazaguanine synthase
MSNKENKKVVLGLSGGMDSATLAAFFLSEGYQVIPISFNYGSKHSIYEQKAAEKFADYYGLKIQKLSLPFISQLFKSNLLKTGGDIPEGHYEDSNMSLTVVPARNIIFISIMAGYAWSVGASYVAIGVHSGDHAIYADCREEFVASMNAAIVTGTEGKVRVLAPFQHLDKTGILEIGNKLFVSGYDVGVPYQFTRTCYKDQELSCGKCGSCVERLEAFTNLGIKDPILYK